MNAIKNIFGRDKVAIAMVHVRAVEGLEHRQAVLDPGAVGLRQ